MTRSQWRIPALLAVGAALTQAEPLHADQPVAAPAPGESLSQGGYLFVTDGDEVTPLAQAVLGLPVPIDKHEGCSLLVQWQGEDLWLLEHASRREEFSIHDVVWGGVGIETCVGQTQLGVQGHELAVTKNFVLQPLRRPPLSDQLRTALREQARQYFAADPMARARGAGTEYWYDELQNHPAWRVELHPWMEGAERFILAQGARKMNPDCDEAPEPAACRDLSENDGDVDAAGVVLLEWQEQPGSADPVRPRISFSSVGRWDNENGRIELVDLVQVQGAPAPWFVLQRTVPGYWSFDVVTRDAGGNWRTTIVGGSGNNAGDGSTI